MNPLQKLIKDYQIGVITLFELKPRFFQKLGEIDDNSFSEIEISDDVLAALTEYANSFPPDDDDWIQIGSCCCHNTNCIHSKTKVAAGITALRNGVEKFHQFVEKENNES